MEKKVCELSKKSFLRPRCKITIKNTHLVFSTSKMMSQQFQQKVHLLQDANPTRTYPQFQKTTPVPYLNSATLWALLSNQTYLPRLNMNHRGWIWHGWQNLWNQSIFASLLHFLDPKCNKCHLHLLKQPVVFPFWVEHQYKILIL